MDDQNVSIQEPANAHGILVDGPPGPGAHPNSTADKLHMPCGHKMNGRNLIVCIDGTANKFGKKNTNVIELYNLILKKVEHNQRTWYNSGIGTYARPSMRSLSYYMNVLYHKLDMGFAWGHERTVLGAYRWLSENYEDDDCIFLFGFSRGAFQVRALSAMIEKVGLIYKGNEMQIPFAYELYANRKNSAFTAPEVGSHDPNHGEPLTMADRFKKTFSNENVKVHFVGAWDTVSSIHWLSDFPPGTKDGMTHVCYFRHALALDERRVDFRPEYAYGPFAKPPKSSKKTNGPSVVNEGSRSNLPFTEVEVVVNDPKVSTGSKRTLLPQTKEVWFPGTHSDIGGGNVENAAMDRSTPPLRWMVFEAAAAGLRTARFQRELSASEQVNIVESLTGCWWILGIVPKLHVTVEATGRWHVGYIKSGGRQILPGQKIHSSLLRTGPTAQSYIPKARPVDDDISFWTTLRDKGITPDSEWLELDLYEYSGYAVEKLVREGDDTALKSMYHITISGDARQAVYTKAIEALEKGELTAEVKHQLLRTSMQVLKTSGIVPHLKLSHSAKIHPTLSELLNDGNKEHQTTARAFLALFTDCYNVFYLPDAPRNVLTVAISLNATRIVSCALSDGTARIWDVETGKQVGEPLLGHSLVVVSVAFSHDGRHIVSGSLDDSVRIWETETGKPVGEPLRGHSDSVRSVAFSPDGWLVVSGSDDNTVRIWDVESGYSVGEPLRGHSRGGVTSVAFSSDGKRIVSGSRDLTVRIWNVETGKPVGKPLRGHHHWVNSVAFSTDGRRIVSGSEDGTVLIWHVETGNLVGEPLQGHTYPVRCVAFSPDDELIASGSRDQTVRIWDAETGKPLGEPLPGHTIWVDSVAFTPDGTRIASASNREVLFWDLKDLGLVDTPAIGQTEN